MCGLYEIHQLSRLGNTYHRWKVSVDGGCYKANDCIWEVINREMRSCELRAA